MSALTDRITAVLREHEGQWEHDAPYCEDLLLKCCNMLFDDRVGHAAHVAGRIEAELQLTEERVGIPTWSETGEMIPNPMVQGPDMIPKRRMDFIPSRRWVTPYERISS